MTRPEFPLRIDSAPPLTMSAPDALASIRPRFVPIFVQSFLCILKLKPRDILSSSTFPSWHFLPGYMGGDLSISGRVGQLGPASQCLCIPSVLLPSTHPPLNPPASTSTNSIEPTELKAWGKASDLHWRKSVIVWGWGNPDIACKAERFG